MQVRHGVALSRPQVPTNLNQLISINRCPLLHKRFLEAGKNILLKTGAVSTSSFRLFAAKIPLLVADNAFAPNNDFFAKKSCPENKNSKIFKRVYCNTALVLSCNCTFAPFFNFACLPLFFWIWRFQPLIHDGELTVLSTSSKDKNTLNMSIAPITWRREGGF